MARFALCIGACACALIVMNEGHCRRGARSEIPAGIEEEKGPWFTGPLLTPSAHVVPVGYMNLEPYLFVFDNYAFYDSEWRSESEPKIIEVNPLVSLQLGLTQKINLTTSPQVIYARRQGKSSTQFGDLPIGFDFEIHKDTAETWYPAVKFTIRESFPTGKYQKLNPKKDGTDGAGSGSYITGFGITFGRLFHTGGVHYLNTRLNVLYNIPARTHVKGFNVYGGGFDTKGKVRPGNTITALVGLEYTLALHWALALDIAYNYGNKTRFSGKSGFNADGTPATVGEPSFNQISLAPAIEYNFNESVGIIAGSWFTVAGRNSQHFASGVIAVNWYTAIKKQKKK